MFTGCTVYTKHEARADTNVFNKVCSRSECRKDDLVSEHSDRFNTVGKLRLLLGRVRQARLVS